jgi:hypothetical protein
MQENKRLFQYLDLSDNPVIGANTLEELKRKLGENFVI